MRSTLPVAMSLIGMAGMGCPARTNRDAPPVAHRSDLGSEEPPWQLDREVVGLVERRLIVWDRAWDGGRGGVAEYSASDGQHLRTRSIAGLSINGEPRFWQAVTGGYLGYWDGPALVAERGDQLALAWSAPGSDWFSDHVVLGDTLVLGGARAAAAVVRLRISDGRELWRAPLVPWSQDVTVETDGQLVYASWVEYDPGAPTPTVRVARRIRALDPATGATRWTHDFAAEPGALTAGRDTIVAAVGGDLVFIDGATGTIAARHPLGPANVYPAVLVDRDQVYAALGESVTAFELPTGARRWHTTVAALDGGPELAVAGDQVLVTTAGGTVVALDPTSGAQRWEVGVGLAPHALMTTPDLLVARAAGRAAGFALPPTMPSESARIHGRVVAGRCRELVDPVVTVAGVPVAVDGQGAYQVTVDARGLVLVTVSDDHPEEGRRVSDTATVRLVGRRDYLVPDLTPGPCQPD